MPSTCCPNCGGSRFGILDVFGNEFCPDCGYPPPDYGTDAERSAIPEAILHEIDRGDTQLLRDGDRIFWEQISGDIM